MKPTLLLLGVLGAGLLWSPWATPRSPAAAASLPTSIGNEPGSLRMKGVRAQYVNRGSKGWVDTDCFIVNTSATEPLALRTILILGRDGLKSIIAAYQNLDGKSVPPLGQVVLPIDRKIPGVEPQNGDKQAWHDVATVVVLWEGPADALKLSAIIHYWEPTNSIDGFRGTSVAEGYDLKL